VRNCPKATAVKRACRAGWSAVSEAEAFHCGGRRGRLAHGLSSALMTHHDTARKTVANISKNGGLSARCGHVRT
jgi:hypothetical protein